MDEERLPSAVLRRRTLSHPRARNSLMIMSLFALELAMIKSLFALELLMISVLAASIWAEI